MNATTLTFAVQTADRLEKDADEFFALSARLHFGSDDYRSALDEADDLAGQAMRIRREHEVALSAVRICFSQFDAETRESGYLNACDTMLDNGVWELSPKGTNAVVPAWVLDTVEFWEMAVASAQSLKDSA